MPLKEISCRSLVQFIQQFSTLILACLHHDSKRRKRVKIRGSTRGDDMLLRLGEARELTWNHEKNEFAIYLSIFEDRKYLTMIEEHTNARRIVLWRYRELSNGREWHKLRLLITRQQLLSQVTLPVYAYVCTLLCGPNSLQAVSFDVWSNR